MIRVLLALLVPSFALAAPAVPEPLQPWVDWVLDGHDDLACPVDGADRVCVWPGELALSLGADGGSFRYDVTVDRSGAVTLPGDATWWPRDVADNGSPARMRRVGDRPTVVLAPGHHTLTGKFAWSRLPESLRVPGRAALLTLRVDGAAVPWPRRDDAGALWLQGSRAEETAAEDRLALDVHRRIEDGVPVVVSTRLKLRVSGQSREVNLGSPLPAGLVPVELTSPLPARLDADGHLVVQLRPGEWTLQLKARSEAAVASLAPPAGADWPEEEIWVFSANPAVRAVKLEGVPGVDPQRTSLDADWRGLPAWRVAAGAAMSFVELRRGESEPPPDRVVVQRELWLRQGGEGFVVRDRLSGQLHQGGRLEVEAPAELGQVEVGGEARVINHLDGGADGVEVRDGSLSATATLSYPDRGELPAVGWSRDATQLGGVVHLPPGWTILAATGVDRAEGTWIDQWTLLDLFGLLLISLVCWRVLGLGWGGLALVALAISWHEAEVPTTLWLLALLATALLGVLSRGRLGRVVGWIRWGLVGLLVLQLLGFSWGQIRTGLWPQLERGGGDPLNNYAQSWDEEKNLNADQWAASEVLEEAAPMEQMAKAGRGSYPASAPARLKKSKMVQRAAQVDPQAVVQTGPGVPRWSWRRHALTWNGPVSAAHTMKLWLLPPGVDALLSVLRVLALLGLALRLADPRRLKRPPATEPESEDELATVRIAPGAVALLLPLLSLFAVGSASASEPLLPPSAPDVLTELEQRLTASPDCAPQCVEFVSLDLAPDDRGLTMTLVVDAAASAAIALPGPDGAWVPASVQSKTLGRAQLRRRADGFLLLRLPEGRHTVVLRGPARDQVALRFPVVPRTLTWSGDGWTLDGYRPDAPPPPSVQLARARALDAPTTDEAEAQTLPPWLELRRELDVGVPWLVHNELRRLGPTGSVVRIKVPLLPGESVTTPGISVAAAEAEVTLQPGESVRSWDSTLAEAESLVLTAPTDRDWAETWELDCSPIFRCAATGLAPTRHMADARWKPRWQPWPGESVSLSFTRPIAADGETTTVDRATLDVRPGRRVRESTLVLSLRSSQGGEQRIGLPPGSDLVSFRLDDRDVPVQREGDSLGYPVEPGAHTVSLTVREEITAGFREVAPAFGVPSAANVTVTVRVPENKWLLWAGGPTWGAVVTWWQYVVLIGLIALLLGRYAPTRLRTWQWFLLGLGMTQVEVVAPIVVVGWLCAMGWRGRNKVATWWGHDLLQLALVGATVLAFGMMWWAVYEGLLYQPDMQVEGAGSGANELRWYADAATGTLPQPWLIWLPLWTWKLVMLLWALWLAGLVFREVVAGWADFVHDGLWKMPPKSPKSPKAAKAAKPTPPNPPGDSGPSGGSGPSGEPGPSGGSGAPEPEEPASDGSAEDATESAPDRKSTPLGGWKPLSEG